LLDRFLWRGILEYSRYEKDTSGNEMETYHDEITTLEPVRFTISHKVTNNEYGKNEQEGPDVVEVEIHCIVGSPTSNDDNWCDEKSSLDGSTKTML